MTGLTKPIKRETEATQFQKSELRNIIVSVEPVRSNAVIGLRLKGTRQTYRIGVSSCYLAAVQLHLQKIEKEAKRLAKDEGIKMRTARARARKKLIEDLK